MRQNGAYCLDGDFHHRIIRVSIQDIKPMKTQYVVMLATTTENTASLPTNERGELINYANNNHQYQVSHTMCKTAAVT